MRGLVVRSRHAAGLLAALLTGCSALLVYTPSDKYDNKVVRGEVTHIATQDEMRKNYFARVVQLPDAPTLEDFLAHYQRVTVTVERGLGSGLFSYPFESPGQKVSVGDIVDVPVYVGGPLVGKFLGRPQISKVVCAAMDSACKSSLEGRLRGAIGEVPPR